MKRQYLTILMSKYTLPFVTAIATVTHINTGLNDGNIIYLLPRVNSSQNVNQTINMCKPERLNYRANENLLWTLTSTF